MKRKMNPKTKRAVVVLTIIALLILIAGLVSCSIQLLQNDTLRPSVIDIGGTISALSDSLVIPEIRQGNASNLPDDGTLQGVGDSKQETIGKGNLYPAKAIEKQPGLPFVPILNPGESVPAEQPEQQERLNKPGRPGGGRSYPAAMVVITIPDYSHTDMKFEVKTVLSNVKSLEWTIKEEGKDTPQEEFLKGMLDKNGGKINITKPGQYVLTATAKNYGNRTYTFTKTITIYPIFEIKVESDKNAHTDQAFVVKTTLSDNIKQQLNWHIYKDGSEVKWHETVTGSLNNDGGMIQIKDKGRYTLKATAYDETNREFSGKSNVIVYPIVEISVQVPDTAHTDTAINVETGTKELGDLTLMWTVMKNGEKVPLADCLEGELNNIGGTVHFLSKGNYSLIATVTDKAGRVFTGKADIKIYPVAIFSYDLPATTHTDKPVLIKAVSSELQDMIAEWTVIYNGKITSPETVLEGDLTNEGGTVRFKSKGIYILKVLLIDDLGREYRHEASTVVYPVAETGFYMPPQTHTDIPVEVKTSFRETDGLTAEWSLIKDGNPVTLEDGFDGTLTNEGGKIHFYEVGAYVLQATVIDDTGRKFTYTAPIKVYPVVTVSLELTKETHTDKAAVASVEVKNAGSLSVVWSIEKDNVPVQVEHELADKGGYIHFLEKGSYTVTASITDHAGRVFFHSRKISVYPLYNCNFFMPSTIHTGQIFAVNMENNADFNDKVIVWTLSKDGNSKPVSEFFKGSLSNNGGTLRVDVPGTYTLIATIVDELDREFSASQTITVTNMAPAKPTLTANKTRTYSNGKFLVNMVAVSTDPDGDNITYEYQNKAANDYYPVGTHTVQVRAKDNYGGVSEWTQTTFTIFNSAPTTPVITRTPNGNSVAPGTAVTIKAASTDPDGDVITYVWEGRNSETQTYPLGKNTVRVKAVDKAGAESPWAAIIFFVADPNRGGGMTLTGPGSTIIENGVSGATITSWTFTVPQVSGHSASYDYGQVRGYNQLTGRWEQLPTVSFNTSIGSSFAATDGNPARVYSHNGVYMYGTLQAGVYTMLEFYYYTPHTCMYNKSNITYSVEYHFK